jgi:hypothetical protein
VSGQFNTSHVGMVHILVLDAAMGAVPGLPNTAGELEA